MQYQVLICMLLIFVVGCETSTKPEPVVTTKKSEAQTEKTESTPVSSPPRYKPVVVQIKNHSEIECTSTFSPQQYSPETNLKHGLICGPAGAVSKLNWEYLGTDEQGDHYRFERSFPDDKPNRTLSKKEVIYQGQVLIIFENDTHQISMFPSEVDQQKQKTEVK